MLIKSPKLPAVYVLDLLTPKVSTIALTFVFWENTTSVKPFVAAEEAACDLLNCLEVMVKLHCG